MTIPPDLERAPSAIREYLRRCGNGEEPVAWWVLNQPKDPHEALWVITFNRAARMFTVSSFPVIVSHWDHQVFGSSYSPLEMRRQLDDGLWGASEAGKASVRGFTDSLPG